jgi:hypothetical protein
MFKFRIVLALLTLAAGLNANAQHSRGDRGDRDDGVSGGICQIGVDCDRPGHGGGGSPVDPSPYDPRPDRPGRPGRPDHPNRPDNPFEPGRPGNPWEPGRPDRPDRPDYPDYPQYPDRPHYGDRREIYVSRRVQNEHMDLLQLAGLDRWSDRGTEIESVEIYAQPGAVQSSLALNADGFVVDSENWPSSYNVLTPNRRLVIGDNLNQLSLGVRGVLYIDRIVVNIRNGGYNPPPPPPPQDGVAQGYVGQSFYYDTVLDLERATDLYRYRGYRVVSVTIRGRQLDSRGSGRVIINGVTAGRINLQSGRDTVRMPINAVVGRDLQSLDLQIVPSLQIDSVEIGLSRY